MRRVGGKFAASENAKGAADETVEPLKRIKKAEAGYRERRVAEDGETAKRTSKLVAGVYQRPQKAFLAKHTHSSVRQ